MMWDDEKHLLRGELEEPHVWATLTERTRDFPRHDFEVFLYPGSTRTRPMQPYGTITSLRSNALNTVWDLTLPKP